MTGLMFLDFILYLIMTEGSTGTKRGYGKVGFNYVSLNSVRYWFRIYAKKIFKCYGYEPKLYDWKLCELAPSYGVCKSNLGQCPQWTVRLKTISLSVTSNGEVWKLI